MPSSSTSRHLPTAELERRVKKAVARRQALAESGDTTAYRLVNRAGDGLPDVSTDRFGEVLVLSLFEPTAEVEPYAIALADAVPGIRAIYVKRRPSGEERVHLAPSEQLSPREPVWGTAVESLQVDEQGIVYEIRPAEGLSVGLFLDMREVREWVRQQAGGRSVLNLFAYTCAFGVCAMLGSASRALNLDASRQYLAWGQANYGLNGLAVDEHDFVFGDALDWLGRFARRGQTFDAVILDPPSFSTVRGSRFSAAQDYTALAAAAVRVVAPRGMLIAATNHAGISQRRFQAMVDRGLAEAGRSSRAVRCWNEPEIDFPVPSGSTPYLKVLALECT